ncbi:hypothetical protein VB005_08051 [Metarhizium brunneum]
MPDSWVRFHHVEIYLPNLKQGVRFHGPLRIHMALTVYSRLLMCWKIIQTAVDHILLGTAQASTLPPPPSDARGLEALRLPGGAGGGGVAGGGREPCAVLSAVPVTVYNWSKFSENNVPEWR